MSGSHVSLQSQEVEFGGIWRDLESPRGAERLLRSLPTVQTGMLGTFQPIVLCASSRLVWARRTPHAARKYDFGPFRLTSKLDDQDPLSTPPLATCY